MRPPCPVEIPRLPDNDEALRPPAQITVWVGIRVPSERVTCPLPTSLTLVPRRICTPRAVSFLAAYAWAEGENALRTAFPASTRKICARSKLRSLYTLARPL